MHDRTSETSNQYVEIINLASGFGDKVIHLE